MPRKDQGWITFQSSEEERQILETICQQSQRTKTEVLREMIRQLGRSATEVETMAFSDDFETAVEARSDPLPVASLPTVQLSARNILPAQVIRMVKSGVNVEVSLAIAPGVELIAIITRTSAENLALQPGKAVFAIIKSTSIMIGSAPEASV